MSIVPWFINCMSCGMIVLTFMYHSFTNRSLIRFIRIWWYDHLPQVDYSLCNLNRRSPGLGRYNIAYALDNKVCLQLRGLRFFFIPKSFGGMIRMIILIYGIWLYDVSLKHSMQKKRQKLANTATDDSRGSDPPYTPSSGSNRWDGGLFVGHQRRWACLAVNFLVDLWRVLFRLFSYLLESGTYFYWGVLAESLHTDELQKI